jgi:hypothetical protein
MKPNGGLGVCGAVGLFDYSPRRDSKPTSPGFMLTIADFLKRANSFDY